MASLNVRLSQDEASIIEQYRQKLQERHGRGVRVTQKTVIIEALDALGSLLDAQQNQPSSSLTHPSPQSQPSQ